LTNMTEYAAPKPRRDGERYRMREAVCASCSHNEITQWKEAIICTACHARVCVLCGCTDEAACPDGCSWMLPGVCSTHDGDVRIAALAVPPTTGAVMNQMATSN